MGSTRIAAATDSAQGQAILLTRRRSKDSKRRKKKTPSLEEQYEAETAGMSAAERLRFFSAGNERLERSFPKER
ncbi:hypothetical protein PF005_g29522 [Phytophthora fragariae]|uniref:Uncharacterized protein n=1 Tax=Phytophthora fragariae TaxID=53985 RepID=A0A6A4B7Q0_9STRA|nr:hypothetical protein PF003_g21006 [Phytophthora fragariae]KAE8919778.1 hypothetical protein PF009_g29920 [Phytophthora fragariae]KAE8964504.1 hypothetical protein PF011_g28641 [Phytophthora fragariae]KAE9063015.1 hypothetical protein PF010_g29161 [Phytophthora fragariae]KAE9063923.1 hypothetical protein PF007_g29382 [Phytophthora fragariae]